MAWWDDAVDALKDTLDFVGIAIDAAEDPAALLPGAGMIDDAIDGALENFYDSVIEPALDLLRDAIIALQAEIRILKHNLKKALAEWLDNDWFFLTFVTAVVLAIIFVPKIVAWFKETRIFELATDLIQNIKSGVVDFLDVNKIIDLHTLNQILRVFWDDYNELMSTWSQAVAALAADLGEGSAYILAGTSAVRGIVHGYHSVLGLPPESAEMRFYDGAQKFAKRVDDRFRRYAYDPGLIYVDLMNEWLIPEAEHARDANEQQTNEIRENYNRSVEIETGLKEMQTGVNDLIEWMPAEIEAQFNRRWEPINEWLNESFEWIDKEIMARFEKTVLILEERMRWQQKVNQAAFENSLKFDAIAESFWFLSDEAQENARANMTLLLMDPDGKLADEQERFDAYLTGANRLWGDFILPDYPALGYEPETAGAIVGRPKGDIPSPFVGDY